VQLHERRFPKARAYLSPQMTYKLYPLLKGGGVFCSPSENRRAAGKGVNCGFVRYLFHISYFAVTIGCAVVFMSVTQFGSGASLAAGSFIAWVGGCGARGSLYGTTGQKIIGALLGSVAIIGGLFLAYWGESMVVLLDIGFPAPLWALIGAVIGFVFVGRRDAAI
jgi:hypothetical protein